MVTKEISLIKKFFLIFPPVRNSHILKEYVWGYLHKKVFCCAGGGNNLVKQTTWKSSNFQPDTHSSTYWIKRILYWQFWLQRVNGCQFSSPFNLETFILFILNSAAAMHNCTTFPLSHILFEVPPHCYLQQLPPPPALKTKSQHGQKYWPSLWSFEVFTRLQLPMQGISKHHHTCFMYTSILLNSKY